MGGPRLMKLRLIPAALVAACFASLGACGETSSPDDSGPPLANEQAPTAPKRPVSKLAAQARAARGPGLLQQTERAATSGDDALARHFQLRGTARFVRHDPTAKPSLQELEIALAGPQLQRYQLSSGDYKNWFLLGGPGDAWLKTPNDQQPRPFSSEAAILEEDATLRWLILRFPIDLMRGPEATERSWSETWEAGGLILFREDLEGGQLLIKLDEQGLPAQVYRALAEGSSEPQLLLEVSDWKLEHSSPEGVRNYPRRWVWHRDDWRVEEVIDQIEDRALYLDIAFRPADAPVSSFQIRRTEDGSSRRIPRDRFALVQRSLHYQLLDAIEPEPTPEQLIWKLWDGTELRYALQVDEANPGADSISIEAQLCLLWSSAQRKDHEQARERLVQAAAENGLEVLGPLWFNTSVDGLEALLPVRRAD